MPTQRSPEDGATSHLATARTWWGLAVLMLPVLLVSIDNTVLSFALPQITEALRPSAGQLVWIVDVYPLVLAGLLVTMGTLGDRFGRRRLLLIGAIGFAAARTWAAFAADPETLIVTRALTGFFGATLMPSTLGLLRGMFEDPDQRRRAVAVWAATFSAGSAIGPIVGGLLLEHFGWGSIFLMTLPLLVVFLATAPFLVPESKDPSARRIDPASVAWSIGTMIPLVYGLSVLPHGEFLTGSAALVLGVGCGIVFVRRQLHLDEPLLEVRLFTRPRFSASVVANLVSMFALSGLLFFLSQFLQSVLDMGPLSASLVLLPGVVAALGFGLGAVPLLRRFPLHVLVPVGLVLSALGYALVAVSAPVATVLALTAAVFLVNAGVGLAETLTNDAILDSVPAPQAGAASAISETAYELGSALGVAILGSTVTAVYTRAIALPDGVPDDLADQATETIGAAVTTAQEIGGDLGDSLLASARDAFESGVALTSWMAAAALAVTAFAVWRVLRGAAKDTQRTPAP